MSPRSPRATLDCTYWAVHGLSLLGVTIHEPSCLRGWIAESQDNTGGFRYSPNAKSVAEIWPTYCAIHLWAILDHV